MKAPQANERGDAFLKAADRMGGIPLAFFCGLGRKFLAPLRQPENSPPKRIGILCPGAIGDLLLGSALANALKKKFPSCHIEALASLANAGAAGLAADIDSSHAFPVRRPDLFIRQARKSRYDVLFDLSQWARVGAIIAALSGASRTVGFSTRGQYRAFAYDMAVRHEGGRHELENFLALGRALWPDLTGAPSLALPGWERGETVYCHMHPARGKGGHLKRWPENLWAALLAELGLRGIKMALTGSPQDREANESFLARHFPRERGIANLAGESSLAELAHFFTRARAVVSVNTGIMHLAAISGAPTVGLHGATSPARWGPAGPRVISLLPRSGASAYLNLGFEYPKGAVNSLQWLPVEDVLDALASLDCLE